MHQTQPNYGSHLHVGQVIATGAAAEQYSSNGSAIPAQAIVYNPHQYQHQHTGMSEEEEYQRALQESLALSQMGQTGGGGGQSAVLAQLQEDFVLQSESVKEVTAVERQMSETIAEMGFSDHAKNVAELRAMKGALERTIDKLFESGYTEAAIPNWEPGDGDAPGTTQTQQSSTTGVAPPPPQSGEPDLLIGSGPSPDLLGDANALLGDVPFEAQSTPNMAPTSTVAQRSTGMQQHPRSGQIQPPPPHVSPKPSATLAPTDTSEELGSMLGVLQTPPHVAASPPPPPDAEDDDDDDDDEPPPEPVATSGSDLLADCAELLDSPPEPAGPTSHKESLEMFFRQHKPENLDKIDKLLSGYAGREDTLYDKLADKYGVKPTWPLGIEKPVATPKSRVKSRSRGPSNAASPAVDK